MNLNLLQIYLVELTKNFQELSPDQQTCLNYLTTDFFFEQGDQNMNQNTPKTSQDLVHQQASSEVKKWIEEAHARLEYFAGQPDQREAYEQEFLNILDHNTAANFNYNEGKAEGKAERDIEIAKNMLSKNYPISDISAMTGLSSAELEHLRTKM